MKHHLVPKNRHCEQCGQNIKTTTRFHVYKTPDLTIEICLPCFKFYRPEAKDDPEIESRCWYGDADEHN